MKNFKTNIEEFLTMVVVLIAAALFFIIPNDFITIVIAVCSGVCAFLYFLKDAQRNISQDNKLWIYPGILFLITLILGYSLPDKLASHACYFLSVIMFIRTVLNFIYSMVIDVVSISINKITKSLDDDIKNVLSDLEKKFGNSVIPLTTYEQRVAIIRENCEQKIRKLNDDLASREHSLEKLKIESERAKKIWEEKSAEYEKKIVNRNEIIEDLTIKQDKFIKQLEKNPSQNQTLENKLIRDKFDEALKHTTKELDIFSPWVSDNVVDSLMTDKFRTLLEKGVTIKIRYGINSLSGNALSQKTRYDSTEKAIKDLKREFKMYPKFKVYKDNSHAKLFICDDKYYVISSFNILSFRGDYTGLDQRRELGELSYNKDLLNEYRKHYFNF